MAKAKSAAWRAGADYGHKAACEIIKQHGCILAENNLRDLSINSRRRDADDFDRGYTHGYGFGVKGCSNHQSVGCKKKLPEPQTSLFGARRRRRRSR